MGRLRLLLVIALLLVPGAAAGSADHQLLFSERTTRFVAEGQAAEGETRGYRFTVAEPNVTRIEFILTWSEDSDKSGFSKPDRFSLAVTDPTKFRFAPASSASGEARVSAQELNVMPQDERIAEEDVATRLADLTTYKGTGEWQVQVRLEDAGNPQGATVDTGNAFRLVVLVHYYQGTPLRVVSLAPSTGSPMADMVDAPNFAWALAAGGLALAACGMGVVLVVRAVRARRERMSPLGGNTGSQE